MIVAQAGQTLIDISLQGSGTIENLFALAAANGLSITNDLTAGQDVDFEPIIKVQKVLDYYAAKNIFPASGLTAAAIIPSGGIGFMIIGTDFIIV